MERTPGWCDRILWRSLLSRRLALSPMMAPASRFRTVQQPDLRCMVTPCDAFATDDGSDGVLRHAYFPINEGSSAVCVSDHSPVCCGFVMSCTPPRSIRFNDMDLNVGLAITLHIFDVRVVWNAPTADRGQMLETKVPRQLRVLFPLPFEDRLVPGLDMVPPAMKKFTRSRHGHLEATLPSLIGGVDLSRLHIALKVGEPTHAHCPCKLA